MSKQKYDRINILDRELRRRKKRNRLATYYPDEGPLRRELYVPQMDFFRAGTWARERCTISANGIGKTEAIGGYEVTLHLTGLYPDWWEGRRFNHPIDAWAAGDTGQTVKDIIQAKLLGRPGEEGTGLIPGDCIAGTKKKAGAVADAVEIIQVKHVSGGVSNLTLKSFAEGRQSFQGTERHIIWLDEECPETVYDECLMRTRTVNGMVLLTFTPLSGLTQTVKQFAPNGRIPKDGKASPSKFVNSITWEHAPHLTEEEKKQILSSTLPHLRDARSKGIPHLGSGVIYPIDHEVLKIEDFPIPVWYKRVYGLDYGWNFTAALWAALDPDNDVLYITDAYKRGHAEPPIHAAAILARGDWIPGVADPSKGTSQRDGKALLTEYSELLGGLLYPAKNAVEAGLFSVWNRMSTGRLKIFKRKAASLLDELTTYHRNEKGEIVKVDDHLCDDLRYICISGIERAIEMPDEDDYEDYDRVPVSNSRMNYVS